MNRIVSASTAFASACVLAVAVATFTGSAAVAQTTPTLAPVLEAREGWLGGSVVRRDLTGKVVVVDIFTFGCSNCKNVVPALRRTSVRDRGEVVVVGVHSPETPYERDRSNVAQNLQAQGITWPVAIDNSFAIWNAYGVQAWPTQLIFDRHGRLRKTLVGDSQDDALDATLRQLVAEK